MNFKYLILSALAIAVIFTQTESYGQCGSCSAAFSGSAMAAGTSNVGVLKEGSIRTIGIYRYLYGSRYYEASNRLNKFSNEELSIHFSGIHLGYGVTKRFTIETELSAFPNKDLNMGFERTQISGLSSAAFIGKYTIFADRKNKQEITLGGGARLPLTSNTVLSGNLGAMVQFFFFKNLFSDVNLILSNRSEFFAKDSQDFHLGNSYVTSLFISSPIIENLNGIAEIRYDHLDQSNDKDGLIEDSGRSLLSFVPQINFQFNKFSISVFSELPIHKEYKGTQLGEDIGLGLAFIIMF